MKNFCKIALIVISIVGLCYSGIPNDTKTWIRIGSLNSSVDAWGAERGWNPNANSYEGMQWPAWYDKTDNFVIDRQFMACKDFTGADGVVLDYKSVKFSNSAGVSQIIPQSLSQTTRYPACMITVDDIIQTSEEDVITDMHSASESPADRMVTNVVRTGMGITMTRKVYAFSRGNHDNYNIIEYTFENTGNIDDDDSLEINGTIHDFYFGMISRYCTSEEVYNVNNLRQGTWGAHQWVHHTPMVDDPDLPYFYTWMGQAQTHDITLNYDNIGVPVLPEEAPLDEARIRCPQFAGTAVLHSDLAYDNPGNDKSKIRLGWYVGDDVPAEGADQQIWTLLNDNYQGLGQMDTAQDVYAGHKLADRMSPFSVIDHMAGTNSYMSFGPYDIPHGETVTIVLCEAVSGLSRETAKEVGTNWYKAYRGDAVDLTLPSAPLYRDPEPVAENADSMDIYKNMWVYTGKDSILKTFYSAKQNYDSDFGIPLAPPPPSTFEVTSQSDGVDLQWADNSTSDPTFEGYRIYRALNKPDEEYDMIFDCNMSDSNLVYAYKDMNCEMGQSYYYYVVSYGIDEIDGVLESGRAYTQTTIPAGLSLLKPIGKGTKDEPYQISVLDNLFWLSLSQNEWGKYYIQTANINASKTADSESGFTPLGMFLGVYDGCGYTIDSLYINRSENDQVGFFGYTESATVKNLGLTNVRISGRNIVGGLTGLTNSSLISQCYVTGVVEGKNNVGGIAGRNDGSCISYCYNLSTVTGEENVGGICGQNYETISSCYNAGPISGINYAGGIAGGFSMTVDKSFWDTEVSGQSSSAGGTGLTSSEMKMLETYIQAGWDFTVVWTYHADRNQGYPYLLIQKDNPFRVMAPLSISNHSLTIPFMADTGSVTYGLCWNELGYPTISDEHLDGETTDSTDDLVGIVNNLDENTVYYIRAFQSDTGDVKYSNMIKVNTTVFAESGTSDDPYRISEAYQLKWISQNPIAWNKHYIQTADINADTISSSFGEEGWLPIGYNNGIYLNRPFSGSYDGQGYKIDALHLDRTSDGSGMFGYVRSAKLNRIILTNVNIKGNNFVGGLVGEVDNSLIDSCYAGGSVSGNYSIGGLFGKIYDSDINRCSSGNSLSGERYIGGLIGSTYKATVYRSFSNSSVNGTSWCGGLIGSTDDRTILSKCYANGSVNGTSYIGGLIGSNNAAVSDCYSRGSVSGISRAGGLMGTNRDATKVRACFWDKQTSGQSTSAGGSGKTTLEMKDMSSYSNAGWVFKTDDEEGIWNISIEVNDGYPVLSCMYPDLPVPVLSSIGDPIPLNYSLEANYPNPFNPVTTLQYALPEQVDVHMAIYDLTGRKIRDWTIQGQTAGIYKIQWNSMDNYGNAVPSGMYIYRLIAGDFIKSNKMVLMK